jgi:hypothetical protein
MNKQKKLPLFLFVSLFIIISDITFVWVNYLQDQKVLLQSLNRQGQQAESIFQMMLNETAINMQQVATLLSKDPRLQTLFLKGREAVEAEGGGKGGNQATAIRKEMLSLLNAGWQEIRTNYDIRQIHFHLAPGDTSFLRVHAPHKFGDDLSEIRNTIVHANTKRIPTKGFESGRIYSGIRGVVPVFSLAPPGSNSTNQTHIGALEAGTSFKVTLETLKKEVTIQLRQAA